jgi:CHASE3 domain sensor protein
MLKGAKQLIDISKKINAEGLSDVVSHMQSDDAQTLLDNISIAWPSIKRAMQNTLRVIYSHLAG